MQVRRFFVGMDVAKDTLDVTILDGDEKTVRPSRTYENNPDGWAQLVETLDTLASQGQPVQCAMESTGRYHEGVARCLSGRGQSTEVHVINPVAVKRFGQAMLKDSKTDKADSRLIALYLIRMKPAVTPMPTQELQALKEVTRRRRRLVEDRGMEKNRLHATLHRHFPGYQQHLGTELTKGLLKVLSEIQSPQAIIDYSVDKLARISVAFRHRFGTKRAEALTALARQAPVQKLSPASELLVKTSADRILSFDVTIKSYDECIAKMVEASPAGRLLLSIPGVGPVTASTILAEVGDMAKFPSADRFVGYCGLYPIVWESGQVKRKYRMSRKGNRWLKTALLVVAGPARMNNPAIASFADRLAQRGKSAKAIGGAIAAKLARIIWAVLTKNEPWSEEIASRGTRKAEAMLAENPAGAVQAAS